MRTTAKIVRDLLIFAIDREWSGQSNTSCGCHPEYESSCPECDVLRGNDEHTHEASCKLAALIKEARAYLEVELELQENDIDPATGQPKCWAEDDQLYVP